MNNDFFYFAWIFKTDFVFLIQLYQVYVLVSWGSKTCKMWADLWGPDTGRRQASNTLKSVTFLYMGLLIYRNAS